VHGTGFVRTRIKGTQYRGRTGRPTHTDRKAGQDRQAKTERQGLQGRTGRLRQTGRSRQKGRAGQAGQDRQGRAGQDRQGRTGRQAKTDTHTIYRKATGRIGRQAMTGQGGRRKTDKQHAAQFVTPAESRRRRADLPSSPPACVCFRLAGSISLEPPRPASPLPL
jgi:hypothetical protein